MIMVIVVTELIKLKSFSGQRNELSGSKVLSFEKKKVIVGTDERQMTEKKANGDDVAQLRSPCM